MLCAGDLLGGEAATAPAPALAQAGGMFAGLDVGSSSTQPAPSLSSGLDIASPAPHSPVDALAGLQAPPHATSSSGKTVVGIDAQISWEWAAALVH